jgi:hypothetical protein
MPKSKELPTFMTSLMDDLGSQTRSSGDRSFQKI